MKKQWTNEGGQRWGEQEEWKRTHVQVQQRERVGAGETEDDEWETNENMSMGDSTVWAKLGSVEAAAAKAATAGAVARAMVVAGEEATGEASKCVNMLEGKPAGMATTDEAEAVAGAAAVAAAANE